MENMECPIFKECTSVINQNSRCVAQSLCTYYYALYFQLLQTLLVTFQAKNSVRSAPASSALTKSHTEAITSVPIRSKRRTMANFW